MMTEFKFGRTYEQFNWGLMTDDRRIVIRIPVGDLSSEDIGEYLRRKRNPDIPDIPDITIVDHISLLR